jgi:phosphoribosylglycinamide formyltransferase-1
MALRRVAVLISGGGSNLQALIDATGRPGSAARIALVISNRADAHGLVRAETAGIPTRVIDHRRFAERAAFEAEITGALAEADIDLVCLAGFMRILTTAFVEHWRDRMLNIHPSLLPAFRGLHTHARALAAGVRVHGCTFHLVRPELDDGPILVQGVAPVLPDDTEDSLAARVLELEHRCYPLALELLASGRVRLDGETVLVAGERPGERLLLHPAFEPPPRRPTE